MITAIMDARVKQAAGEETPTGRDFSDFIERNVDGILIMERNGTVLFANPAAQAFFRHTGGEPLAARFRLPLPAGTTTEITLTCRNGRAVTAEVRISETKWNAKKVYIAYLRNRAAADAFPPPYRTPEPLYRAAQDGQSEIRSLSRLLSEHPDPMFRIRGERILFVNASGRRLLKDRRDRDPLPAALRSALQARTGAEPGRSIEAEIDGRNYSFRVVSPPGSDVTDVYGRDVTEIRRLEQQFYQAQKMEAVGKLAGGVAHDFNNMMTVVVGYGESLLGEMEADDPRRDTVEEIMAAGKKAAALTHQLLAFSRKQVLRPEIIDLNGVVAGIGGMIKALVGRTIEYRFLPKNDPAMVKADVVQIEQVVLNLAVNARDAMPQGGSLTIETADVELDEGYAREHIAVKPGAYVKLAVSDTGAGMDDQTRSRIFEPFFTTKRHGKGTGLGLATAYGIVKQSGGNIWVYSEPGAGTCFKVYLPHPTVEEDPRPVGRRRREPVGGETILLVENEKLVRHFAKRVLSRNGYTVLEACDGREARSMLRRQIPIELMITDVILPQSNGRALADSIGKENRGAKVLFMSGYSDRGIFSNGILKEGEPFLEKPFTAASLLGAVRDMLSLDESRRETDG